MADNFTPITTQEDFDAAIGDRLKREEKKYKDYLSPEQEAEKYKGYMSPDEVAKKYEGYLSPDDAAEKYKGYLSPEESAAKDAVIKEREISLTKMKVAHEVGIPMELANKISGESEDDIRKDAEVMAKFTKEQKTAPLRSTEPSNISEKDVQRAELSKMLAGMKV